MKPGIIIVALLLAPLFAFSQTRLYVSASASGANNGLSWADAFTDLKSALSLSQASDTIWVAQGTYKPTTGTERDSSFHLKSDVQIYGGFSGTEISLAQRDWLAHPTILSGDIGVQTDSTDNSYTILYMESPDSGTVVDGFIFRHGMAVPPTLSGSLFSPKQCGGAIYVMAFDEFAYPLIRNCRFERNHAAIHGGAVCINGGGDGSVAPQFLDCVFEHNSAKVNGGAVYRRGSSWSERIPDFGNCIFRNNHAGERGGGLYFNDAERTDTMHVSHCQFIQNTAKFTGGGANFNLGREEGSTLFIRGCLFEGNSFVGNSLLQAGAPYSITSFSFLPTREVMVDSSCFTKNTGGYLLVNDDVLGGKLSATRSVYSKNDCGAFLALGPYDESSISDCFIANNNFNQLFAPTSSYVTIAKNTFIEPFLAGVLFDLPLIPNMSIYNNLILADSSIFVKTVSFSNYTINFFNNTVKTRWIRSSSSGADKSQIYFYNSIQIKGKIPYCNDCETGFVHCWLDTIAYSCDSFYITCGPGNLFGLDPLFVNPDSGDFRLQGCSPLINGGNNAYATGISTDIAGTPRIQDGTVDIGAYESPTFGLATEPDVRAACDSAATGAIIAPLASACEPLAVAWQSGNQTGTSLDSLAVGIYSVTLTDAKGRSITFSASIPAAASPTLQVDGSPISCFGAADAALAVMPLTGKSPFAYLWSPPVTTDSVATGLGPGLASVTVTDAWGCSATFDFDIPEPDTLQFSATVTDASTLQSADGSIMVTSVTGGTAPYGYLWSPTGSMESMINDLLTGFYTLTVTDERGCEAVWTFEVKTIIGTTEAEGQAILVIYPNPASEAATVKSEGAMPSFIEIYDAAGRLALFEKISPSGEQWQISLEGLAAGHYMVHLKDKEGKAIGIGKLIKR